MCFSSADPATAATTTSFYFLCGVTSHDDYIVCQLLKASGSVNCAANGRNSISCCGFTAQSFSYCCQFCTSSCLLQHWQPDADRAHLQICRSKGPGSATADGGGTATT